MRPSYNQLKQFSFFYDANVPSDLKNRELLKFVSGLQILNIRLDDVDVTIGTNRYFFDAIDMAGYPLQWDALSQNSQLLGELTKRASELIDSFNEVKSGSSAPWGVKESFVARATDQQVAEFKRDGYVVIPNCISHEFCDTLKDLIDRERALDVQNGKSFDYHGNLAFRIYHLINRDPIFEDCLLHPVIAQMMEALFARPTFHDLFYLSSFHANVLRPGAQPSVWHIDSAVPEPIPAWPIRGNVNLIVHDYDEFVGSTHVVPGSHLFGEIPPKTWAGGDSFRAIEAPKGSLVFWDGRIWHRSGANRSDRDRYALLGCFCSSVFRELSMEENPYLIDRAYTPKSVEVENIIGWRHGVKL